MRRSARLCESFTQPARRWQRSSLLTTTACASSSKATACRACFICLRMRRRTSRRRRLTRRARRLSSLRAVPALRLPKGSARVRELLSLLGHTPENDGRQRWFERDEGAERLAHDRALISGDYPSLSYGLNFRHRRVFLEG